MSSQQVCQVSEEWLMLKDAEEGGPGVGLDGNSSAVA